MGSNIKRKKEFWNGRIKIKHVGSYVDKKKDNNGKQREPTPIEWMNIHVDKEADKAYTANIPTL